MQKHEAEGESEQADQPGGAGGTRSDPDPTQHPGQGGPAAFTRTQVSSHLTPHLSHLYVLVEHPRVRFSFFCADVLCKC